MDSVDSAILNGFGRFGLHLLRYYLERLDKSNFKITHINDEKLQVEEMFKIIVNDKFVRIFDDFKINIKSNKISFSRGGLFSEIIFSNLPLDEFLNIPTEILLECSGMYTSIDRIPQNNLKRIYISATSTSADVTSIMGYNHMAINSSYKFISYGSCTVNAYVPMASVLDHEFKVLESDVSVIHNVPQYQLNKRPDIFERRSCTLSYMAPNLLSFLNKNNFHVNYTVVPITGCSRIDFRFKLKSDFQLANAISAIESITNHKYEQRYVFLDEDKGPSNSLLSKLSAELILSQSFKIGNNLYLSGYFDTENSVNRYYDLIDFNCG